ncbi:MAG: hypothetical protein K8H86_02435, partial [Ignavibacteriaceae bacterium]|nr:hypothetical protein [Ignavibacteriaceae bacterium]
EIMNEIGYYEEFSNKFSDYLKSYLTNSQSVYFSCNKTLDNIIAELEQLSGLCLSDNDTYIPKLKIDIVFAICGLNVKPRLILIEAKYLNQLSLKDYSQLAGYLQVAKTIDLGLLLLIQKGLSVSKLSNDFQEIVRLKKLPMDWLINLKQKNNSYEFKTGIINYTPGNGIDWIDTKEINGISSFQELADILTNSSTS